MTEQTSPGVAHGSWGQDVPGESLALEPLLGAELRVASPSVRLVAVGPRACAVQPSIVSWSWTSEDESWERALGLVPQEPSGMRPGALGWAASWLHGDHVQSCTWCRESGFSCRRSSSAARREGLGGWGELKAEAQGPSPEAPSAPCGPRPGSPGPAHPLGLSVPVEVVSVVLGFWE